MLFPNITTSLHKENLESFSELDEWAGGVTINILLFVIISWHHEIIQQ